MRHADQRNGSAETFVNLDGKKSSGPASVPNAFLIRYSEWSARYLTAIVQQSLKTSSVRSVWNCAKVVPLSIAVVSSPYHRRIYLTSPSCKLLEDIIHIHVTELLGNNGVFYHIQTYRCFSSCVLHSNTTT